MPQLRLEFRHLEVLSPSEVYVSSYRHVIRLHDEYLASDPLLEFWIPERRDYCVEFLYIYGGFGLSRMSRIIPTSLEEDLLTLNFVP